MVTETTASTTALGDLRVVEMGQLIAGPFCAQLLGDLGAEVIKIEPPGSGDPMRQWGRGDDTLPSTTWPVIARNKKSVTLDLRTTRGQELARRLLATADVLVENFRPGTLERWGLGPDKLWEDNPGLVITRVTGFGQDGPYAPRAGYGSIGEAMGGLRYLTGDPDRPPARTGLSIGDSLAGTFAALGTLGAIHARERTGRGQVVDTAIYEAVLAMSESLITDWDVLGHQRERTGPILPGVAPSNVYPSSDGGEVLIAANQDSVFARLCEAIGEPLDTDDERFSTHQARGVHQAELDELIAQWSRHLSTADILQRMHDHGVPAGLVYKAEDMVADPHFIARQAIRHVSDGSGREFAMQAVVPQLTATPGAIRWAGPALGEHTDEILRTVGVTEVELSELQREGVS